MSETVFDTDQPPVEANEPHPVDRQVGRQMRVMRTLAGLSQSELGDQIGVTFQQVQKYERGTNRLSASRLVMMCEALQVSPSRFLRDAGLDFDAPEDAVDQETVAITAALKELKATDPGQFEAVTKIIFGLAPGRGLEKIVEESRQSGAREPVKRSGVDAVQDVKTVEDAETRAARRLLERVDGKTLRAIERDYKKGKEVVETSTRLQMDYARVDAIIKALRVVEVAEHTSI